MTDHNPSSLLKLAEELCSCKDEKCGFVFYCAEHPRMPVRVKYFKAQRTLTITCLECQRVTHRIDLSFGATPS